VFDAHFDFVWRSLRRLGVREADVDDALQEVFVVVHRKAHEFEGRSKITTWLYGICFRVASDYQRKAYVRREEPTDELSDDLFETNASNVAEVTVQSAQARVLLEEVLSTLDVEKRAVFVLYEIEELAVEEIAARVGIPAGTVYSRLKVARELFDKAVQRVKIRLTRDERRSR
jgi:RNA polymerase sigma-70 factor (ECF subfamily)